MGIMELQKNELAELEIHDITTEGNGVGRADGLAVFVPMAAVGDRLRVRLTKVLKGYAYGIIDEVLSPSKDRIEPDCPVFRQCGGCAYRHIGYDAELHVKCGQVFEAFARIGGIRFEERGIIPSPLTDGYRNKAQYPVRADENGRCAAGFFAKRSHRLIESADCRLHPPVFAEILRDILAFANETGITPYREETAKGLLRHIYLRHATATGELMVCLVINGTQLPHADRLAELLAKRYPQMKSLVVNINRENTNVILGEKCATVFGQDHITDVLRGVKIRLSPLSFYQVNREGAERLFGIAEEYARPQEDDLLLDLYCGAGAIGLSMARKVKKLIGVEIIPEAIENARENAALNGLDNCEFLCADATEAVTMLKERGLRPDIVMLDPPRKGCDDQCLKAVAEMSPKRIVMISCNPATAARDIRLLQEEFGYKAEKAHAVDMFPRTGHVECVALMSRVEK